MLGFEPLGSIPTGSSSSGLIRRIISKCYLLGTKILVVFLEGIASITTNLTGAIEIDLVTSSANDNIIYVTGSIEPSIHLEGDVNC